jgi:hypothetical protein
MRYILIFITLISFNESKTVMPGPKASLKILFVGNSLTYYNRLPAIVAQLANMDSVDLDFKCICKPDFSLPDHLDEGMLQKEIATRTYDFVIVQQGPSALDESRRILLQAVTTIKNYCDMNNAKLCVFMVWPSKLRLFDLNKVIDSYSDAAQKTNSYLAPAGQAWKQAWQMDPDFGLYDSDNFHPSSLGSFLSAMTIYATLAKKQNFAFVNYSALSERGKISESEFNIIKKAAEQCLIQQ